MTAGGSSLVSLSLRASVTTVGVGDELPIRVEARNLSAAPVWLIGVVDGAESGARYPRWIPLVEGPRGPLPPPERPDFTSPLGADDFCRLAPGEGFDPTAAVAGRAYLPLAAFGAVTREPGEYRVSLELDTRAEDPGAWLGSLPDWAGTQSAPAILERLRAIPRVRARSNALTVVVRP